MPNKTTKQPRKKKTAYLTKRALVRAIRKGTANLESEAMSLMGYVIKQEGDWVVKITKSGTRERISKITLSKLDEIVLD